MKTAKQNYLADQMMRTVYAPDYDHEAWRTSTEPTRESTPDAFYSYAELVLPKKKSVNNRRPCRANLSASQLRRRLYRAGVKSSKITAMTNQILAGEPQENGSQPPGFWSKKAFFEHFGRHIARFVTHFTSTSYRLMIADEFWKLARDDHGKKHANDFMSQARSTNCHSMLVTQVLLPMPAGNVSRKVSFGV